MPTAAAARADFAAPDLLPSQRHRGASVASFAAGDPLADDPREQYAAAALQALLTSALVELALTTSDPNARAIADGALGDAADVDVLDRLGRLEDALERIAATTHDHAARAMAEDAMALLQGS